MGKNPLLFIKSPPAFFKEIEESDLMEKFDEAKLAILEQQDESLLISQEISPELEDGEMRKRQEKLLFLSNPFQQKAYQPLVFMVNDGREIAGEVQEVNIETHEVMIRTTNDVVHPISISNLDDLLWRGKSFL